MPPVRLEFHAHTIASKDSLTQPRALVEACRRKGVDRIVVTDHNTIHGALAARALAPDLVIVGEEIMTLQGELLTAFVTEEIPRGLHALEAIDRLKAQGAFISVSHPFDRTRSGHWKPADLLMISTLVDAIEVFNARCISTEFNRKAAAFAAEHGLPGTVGSDAHGVIELGAAVQVLPDFADAAGLRISLQTAAYETRRLPGWTRLISRVAVLRKTFGSAKSSKGSGRREKF